MTVESKKEVIIAFHASCIDGAACAWAVSEGLKEKHKDAKVTYVPYAHHALGEAEQKIREAVKPGSEIYFVDVAPQKKFLDELMSLDATRAPDTVHIYDHHKTAVDELKNYKPPAGSVPKLDMAVDENLSDAAEMVWNKMMPDKKAPDVLKVIGMMDRGDGLTTPEAFAAAALVDKTFSNHGERAFHALKDLAKLNFNDMARKGRTIASEEEAKIDRLMQKMHSVKIQLHPGQEPVSVPIVHANVRDYGRAISNRLVEAGNKSGSGVAIAWFLQKNGTVSMSLRSDGEPDCSAIADHLRASMNVTGGGHPNSAAVHFPSLFDFAKNVPLSVNVYKTEGKIKIQPGSRRLH